MKVTENSVAREGYKVYTIFSQECLLLLKGLLYSFKMLLRNKCAALNNSVKCIVNTDMLLIT